MASDAAPSIGSVVVGSTIVARQFPAEKSARHGIAHGHCAARVCAAARHRPIE
jgi:hypothetical protein